jgi:hypothetical protein
VVLGVEAGELSCPIEDREDLLPPSPGKPEDEHLEEVERWSAQEVHLSDRCGVTEDEP